MVFAYRGGNCGAKGDDTIRVPDRLGRSWYTFGWVSLKPASDNPDTTTTDSLRYLPQYGDDLCYAVRASHPMVVEVLVKSSMYEGMAMNAGVPYNAPEDTADVWPDTTDVQPSGTYRWRRAGSYIQGNFKYFRLQRWCDSLSTAFLHVRILDYAAEAELRAYPAEVTYLSSRSIRIPYDQHYLGKMKSTVDADSDGFTAWEEYRGFCNGINGNDYVWNSRLDTTRAQFFYTVFDQANCFTPGMAEAIVDTCAKIAGNSQAILIPINNLSQLSELVYDETDVRHFIDFKSHVYRKDSTWVPNPLCVPLGQRGPYLADAYMHPIVDDSIGIAQNGIFYLTTTARDTGDQEGFAKIQFDPSQTPPWIYPGGGGLYKIIINSHWVNYSVLTMVTNHQLPATMRYDPALPANFERNIAHEFGHAFGLTHHTPCCTAPLGDESCIMTYWWWVGTDPCCSNQNSLNPPPDAAPGWTTWFQNNRSGYGFKQDQWNCAGRFMFRQYGPVP
jgi:hypothetical protein